MKITKENEVDEAIRVFMLEPVNIQLFNLIDQIGVKMRKYACEIFTLGAIYKLGYIHGIQAERKRRSGGKCL